MKAAGLFAGPFSLRVKNEQRWLWLCFLFAPLTLAIVGVFLREALTAGQIALLAVGAMVYVSLARGRLLGTSIRVSAEQFPDVYSVVETCARMLNMPMPHVFVRDDLHVPVGAIGLGPPYSLILSSRWLVHFRKDELEFLVGRELGHIAAGHTRLESIFSPSGGENALIGLVFGAYLRRTEYTCDRIGLLCCGSLYAGTRAIVVSSFHTVAGQVDLDAFADQGRTVEDDPALRMGEWIGQTPYATQRVAQLKRFVDNPLYKHWQPVFFSARQDVSKPAPEPAGAPNALRPANWVARAAAVLLDYVIVQGVNTHGKFVDVNASVKPADVRGMASIVKSAPALNWLSAHVATVVSLADVTFATLVVLAVYSAILVTLTGRTLGMMVVGLRVVTSRFGRVNGVRAAVRYTLAALSAVSVVPLLASVFFGMPIYDRLSGTRVVQGAD